RQQRAQHERRDTSFQKPAAETRHGTPPFSGAPPASRQHFQTTFPDNQPRRRARWSILPRRSVGVPANTSAFRKFAGWSNAAMTLYWRECPLGYAPKGLSDVAAVWNVDRVGLRARCDSLRRRLDRLDHEAARRQRAHG